MDPMLEKYLMNKYPERFAQATADKDEARAEIDKAATPGVFGHLLSGLRGAMEGRSYEDVQGGVDKQAEGMKTAAMLPYYEKQKDLKQSFDVGKEAFGMDRDIAKAGREDTEYASMDSTDSPQAKGYADLIKSMSPNFKTEGMTVRQMEPYVKILKEKYGIDENIKQRKQDSFDRNIDRQERRLDREESIASRRAKEKFQQDEDRKKLLVPELGQYANTEQDAKELKTGLTDMADLESLVQEMIDLRTEFAGGGGELFNRDAVNRGKSLAEQANLKMKDMAKLGALSGPDLAIMRAIIPQDPLSFDFIGNKTMTKLQTVKDRTAKSRDNLIKSRGLQNGRPGAATKNAADLSDDELMKELFK